jgi:hypothetical protein
MKRLLTVVAALLVLSVAAAIPAASADSSYRVHLFACAAGDPQASVVPANTPLYWSVSYASGTMGLVQAFTRDSSQSLTDARATGTTTYSGRWGPITQSNDIVINGWVTTVIFNLPPLAPGQSATLTWTSTTDHNTTDLGLPIDGSGLQYMQRYPASTGTVACTITAA